MKTRTLAKTLLVAALLIAIWGMTPPDLNPAIKSLLTAVLVVACGCAPLNRFVSTHTANHLSLFEAICQAKNRVDDFNDGWLSMVVSWAYDVEDIYNIVDDRHCFTRCAFESHVRHNARCLDFGGLFSATGIIILGVIGCHYHNILALFGLLVFSWLFYKAFEITVCTTTAMNSSSNYSLCPIVAYIAMVVQLAIVAVQFITATVWHLVGREIATSTAYAPRFGVNLGIIQFGLSPLLLAAIICFLLSLFCFILSSHTVHNFINAVEVAEKESTVPPQDLGIS